MEIYHIWALKRSGQHAVIEWLRQLYDDTGHRNNTIPRRTPESACNEAYFMNYEDRGIRPVPQRFTFRLMTIVRSPENCFASRYRHEDIRDFLPDRQVVELWNQHASSPIFQIYFDRWFESVTYRKAIAFWLGRPFRDTGREKLTKAGSSFDQRAFEGRADQMNVLHRYRSNTRVDAMIEKCRIEPDKRAYKMESDYVQLCGNDH